MVRTTIRRLGKGCGAVLDALDAAGGTLRLKELAGTLNNNRARDLRRRTISRLEEAGVVECFGESISLTRDWLDALDCERERAGEIAAERRDRERYNREREAYRNRHRIKPEPVPEYDGEIRELEPVEDAPPELVEALACYLDRHPHRSGEKPSWYAVALWADGYLPSKPQPGAVGAALVSLGVAA